MLYYMCVREKPCEPLGDPFSIEILFIDRHFPLVQFGINCSAHDDKLSWHRWQQTQTMMLPPPCFTDGIRC